ncbi:MAG TPA: thermostable hemolysin [Alphaproteobacteria bacterium]|nr:thermostable hemolysin [Alphaproteobacteria bacterium]
MYAIEFSPVCDSHARLLLDGRAMRRFTPLQPSVIDISARFAPERARVEDFIRGIYHKSYGADIAVRYPTLMSVRNAEGEVLAAAGFRMAREEPLFLEQYTRAPIETVMGRSLRVDIPRDEIAEIGNLASSGKGASVFLFAAIACYLLAHGARYAAVTGTDQLHRRFEMMGLQPSVLCDAQRSLLDSEQKSWGTYYDTQPRVLAGSLESSMCQLNRLLGATYQENGVTLFPRVHKKSFKGFFSCG